MGIVKERTSRKTWVTWEDKTIKIDIVDVENEEIVVIEEYLSKDVKEKDNIKKNEINLRQSREKIINSKKFQCLNKKFVKLLLFRNPKYLEM